jgi:ankyrin repeat protein
MSNNKCKSDDLKQLVTLITLNAVKEIIDNSKDCLNITYNGEFSIVIAAKHNDIEIIQLLESKEANIFNKNVNGYTLEKWARHYGNKKLIKISKRNNK